ncbi:hypothetical protein OIDMADRAFT_133431 [Oidiodendron maius Zn]|uniref:Alpha/beta hydrolase fold-3 domain-containing protein n=1 Tax=Oidiodendron maius (strain Zn) TaxID=913774 RepID=A0A0C3GWX8_OIDMZ|nr:hypothetical protein OIDMADRAFT_133431 [Oidiodendron maius Zn]
MAAAKVRLSFLEKLDLLPAFVSIIATAILAVFTGPFRGQSGARKYSTHISHAIARKSLTRLSPLQGQYLQPSTRAAYEIFARKKGIKPETIGLKHGVLGHWVGMKEAKNILVYFHGGGFALPAAPEYFDFFSTMVEALNTAGGDIAIFFLSYTLTPHATYPTQIRQAVEGVRYIVADTGRRPSNVIIGGDSAGGNLVLAVLSHISHPHSEIEPLELFEPLAGAVAIAPWISFETDWPSMKANRHKDIVASASAKRWSEAYLGGLAGHDYYNEPIIAPADWWKGIKAKQILVLAGGDEVLLSSIQMFTETLQSVASQTETFIGQYETHVAPIVEPILGDKSETQQGKKLKSWLSDRL